MPMRNDFKPNLHSSAAWREWCDTVVKQVRFQPDRAAIHKELLTHLEDGAADFERIGYDRELAERRALEAMGDAAEVGRSMDKAHTTPWNQVWLISKETDQVYS